MASISPAIELQDNFTSILYQVVDYVNLGPSVAEDIPINPILPYTNIPQLSSVEVLVHWQSSTMEDSSGNGIKKQGYSINMLPIEVFQNLNQMVTRIGQIRKNIRKIESNPLNMGVNVTNKELELLNVQLEQAFQEQQNFNQEIEQGTYGANELMQVVDSISSAYNTVETLSGALNLSDILVSTTTCPNTMNDKLQTTQELHNICYFSTEYSKEECQISSDTSSQMETMPSDTFDSSKEISAFVEHVWTFIENTALITLQPLLEKLNEIVNSDVFNQVVSHAGEALSMLVTITIPIIERISNTQALWDFAYSVIDALSLIGIVALEIFDLLVTGIQFVADNWGWISPIIYGVIAALIVYNATMGIAWLTTLKQAAALVWKTACDWAEIIAIYALTIAQDGLNVALAECPLTWIIILVIALVAAFYAAVAAVNKFAETSYSATSIICGLILFIAALIGNVIITLVNLAVDFLIGLWNFIAIFANFLGNVFIDPVGAIIRLFFDLADIVLGIFGAIASAIDTLFGFDTKSVVSGWRNSLSEWANKTFGIDIETSNKRDGSVLHLPRFEYGTAWKTGYSFGVGIEESIANFNPSSLFGTTDISTTGIPTTDISSVDNFTDTLTSSEIGSGVENIAGNTGAMAEAMDITGEELKYLRDIAEQEAINRFTTAEVNIEQTNHNTIKNGMDLDGVVSGLTDAVNEAIEISTEGVHA